MLAEPLRQGNFGGKSRATRGANTGQSAQSASANVKFHLTRPDGRNLFTGYGPGFVAINGTPYRSSVIVTADQVLGWDIDSTAALTEAVFTRLAALPVEI